MTEEPTDLDANPAADGSADPNGADIDSSAYEAIFEAVDDAVFVFDVSHGNELTFRFRENNPAHESATGLNPEDHRGKRPHEFLDESQAEEIIENYRTCVNRTETIEYQETLDHPTGTVEWQTKLTPITEGGTVTQIVGISRDVTDLKNKQRKIQAIYEASTDIGFVLTEPTSGGEDAIIREFSPGAENLFGYEKGSVVGTSISVLHTDEDVQRTVAINQQLENQEAWRDEFEFEKQNGETFHALFTAYPYEEESRQVNLGVIIDISERKTSERELARSRARMEFVLEEIDAIIYDLDPDTQQADVYPGTEHLFGEEFDRIEDLLENVHPEDRDEFEQTIRNGFEAGQPFDIEYRMAAEDGPRWIRSTARPVANDDDEVSRVSGFARDVTERKEREQELRRQQEFLKSGSDVVVLLDEDGEVTFQSHSGEQPAGYRFRNLTGESPIQYIHPEDRDHVQAAFRRLLESPGDGPEVTEYRLRTSDGEWRWYENRARNFLEDPTIDGILVNIRDITARKRREQELQRTRDQLQTQRDSMRLLNDVVRHDVRNDLAVVKGYAEALEDQIDEAGSEALETIQEKTDEVISLTNTARELSQVMVQSEEETKPITLTRALEKQIDEARRDYPGSRITIDSPLPDVIVEADEMIDAVFRNLLKNAVQHNDKEIPEIEISASESADSVQVRIADNGPGVSSGMKRAIFEKGETGLESSGTGLGLYLVETLVERYDGELRVEDNEPVGAVFIVELPKKKPRPNGAS